MVIPFPDVGGHAISRVILHIVWATDHRRRTIDPALEARLERVLRQKASEVRAVIHAFGAATDHVHVLVQLPPDLSVPVLVQRIKGASSHAMRHCLPGGWQRGYWVESVSPDSLERASRYVLDQRAHHESNPVAEPWERERHVPRSF